jgi:GNAT superfamily N-acetyltransferase
VDSGGDVLIRDPKPDDEAARRRLWSNYLTDAVTTGTWARVLDPAIFGRLAEQQGAVVGFALSIVHPETARSPICYLEDLFVDRSMRGRGIGRALIEDFLAQARAKG